MFFFSFNYAVHCFVRVPHKEIRLNPSLCYEWPPNFSVNAQRVVQCWTAVSLAMSLENLGLNIADSSKADQQTSSNHPEDFCYVWTHQVEPAALSGCVVVSPSAIIWEGPGAFSEATVETDVQCKVRHLTGIVSSVSQFGKLW